ncbi:hypothetical protein PENTCL1PPCAC_25866, partial [Pristionchus entomophagus]
LQIWKSSSLSIDDDRKTLPETIEKDDNDMNVVIRDHEYSRSRKFIVPNYFAHISHRRTWTERFQDWFSCIRTYPGEDDDEIEIPRETKAKKWQ